MIKRLLTIFVGIMILFTITPVSAMGQDMSNEEIIKELTALKQRISRLEGELKAKNKVIEEIMAKKGTAAEDKGANWSDKVTFSGAVELDYSYADDSDTGNNTINDSTSDLNIGTAELGAEIAFHEYVTGNLILKGEDLDDNDRVFWDEATITIRKEGFPLYFVGGKRGQPFGAFESHLISDPITKELYEIADTGATFGFIPGVLGLDISATVYKGEALMAHMLEGAYGLDRTYLDSTSTLAGWRASGMRATYEETDDLSSYIANVTMEPIEGMALGAFYNSEPGDGQRNNTLGGMFHLEIAKFVLDAEYITAVQREKDPVNGNEHKESAWFGSIAWQFTDPIEIAARYEAFDDDIQGEQDGHLKDRCGLGLTYTLFEKDSFTTSLMAEYRNSSYEKAAGSIADDGLNEFFAKLAIEF